MFYNAIYPEDIIHYRIARISVLHNQLYIFMMHTHKSMPMIKMSVSVRHLNLPRDLFTCTDIGTLSTLHYVTVATKLEMEQKIFDIINDLFDL